MKEFDIAYNYIVDNGQLFQIHPVIINERHIEEMATIDRTWRIETDYGDFKAAQVIIGRSRNVKYIIRNDALTRWSELMIYVPLDYVKFVDYINKNKKIIKVICH